MTLLSKDEYWRHAAAVVGHHDAVAAAAAETKEPDDAGRRYGRRLRQTTRDHLYPDVGVEIASWPTPPSPDAKGTPEAQWEAVNDAAYGIEFLWDTGDLVGVTIYRTDDERMRPSDLRNARLFPFRRLIEQDRRHKLWYANLVNKGAELIEHEEYQRSAADARRRVESEKRSKYTFDHWERIANLYNTAVSEGDRAPVKYVAETKKVSRSTARNWVSHCRELGLLPPTEERQAKGWS